VLTKTQIQRLRSLREKKHREALGLFVVEGEKVVKELIAAGYPFEEIFATDVFRLTDEVTTPSRSDRKNASATRPPIPAINRITADEMARISHFPTPSPVLAVGKISRETLPIGALDHGLTLALDGVQDAGNVGTLLRIADWFFLDRVLLSPDCADLFNQKVINASMGSFARVRAYSDELAPLLAASRVPVLGCELTGEDVHTLTPTRDAVIVIGSEGRGLSPAVAARITRRVTIPRYGHAESLNAGIAAAIVCDNLRRVSGA
jgi:TrmH family RNA methyltransferase